MTAIVALRRALESLARLMSRVGGWAYILCAVFVTVDVLLRATVGVSSKTTTEITGYLLALGIGWGLAHALTERAHIRVDVLVNRLPLGARQWLHAAALLMLLVFAVFLAWVAWLTVEESWDFGATDNSAMAIPLLLPQGLWWSGLVVFAALTAVVMAETALLLARGDAAAIDRRLGQRSYEDETEETLEAVGMRPPPAPSGAR